jgi:hypothetical protein
MKEKKILFLTLALLLPVAIFIFLKIFGRNQFDVPAIYQEGKVDAPENCNFPYPTPYFIPDSITTCLKLKDADSLSVIYFEPALHVPLKRVSVAFHDAPIKIIAPVDLLALKINVDVLKECILLMKPPHSMVLIDHRNRIRGYYDGSDRDEMDRLIAEMNIILKRY